MPCLCSFELAIHYVIGSYCTDCLVSSVVSTKAQLIEQIDQLTTIKNDLTDEVWTHVIVLTYELSPLNVCCTEGQFNLWCFVHELKLCCVGVRLSQ